MSTSCLSRAKVCLLTLLVRTPRASSACCMKSHPWASSSRRSELLPLATLYIDINTMYIHIYRLAARPLRVTRACLTCPSPRLSRCRRSPSAARLRSRGSSKWSARNTYKGQNYDLCVSEREKGHLL